MKILRRLFWFLVLLVVVGAGGVLSYSLPKHIVVNINGSEVKRVDNSGNAVDVRTPSINNSRDVYYINASALDKSEVFTFRNEDTKFNFPWYFKFDSAEVQSRAKLVEANNNGKDQRAYALVTYYGWRIPMFNMFPNAVDVRSWESSEPPFPVFNTVFLSLLGLITLVLWWKLWRWNKKRQVRAAEKAALRAEQKAIKEAEKAKKEAGHSQT